MATDFLFVATDTCIVVCVFSFVLLSSCASDRFTPKESLELLNLFLTLGINQYALHIGSIVGALSLVCALETVTYLQ